ncbi:MAG TPA: hypothetical protein VJ866_18640 [Pyrinomonadaceae bacterium]|nr:hypothetical protein [Pyrinomonadaceae bacterium]
MTDNETRCFEMFLRVRSFYVDVSAVFASNNFVKSLFDEFDQLIADIQAQADAQAAGDASSRQFTQSKAAAREELERDLTAIDRTARSMSDDFPGIEEKFRFDPELKDRDLLTFAHNVAAAALPLKAEFLKRGIRVDFLEDLAADTAAFEQALSNRTEQKHVRVGATASIDDLIAAGLKRVRQLDPIMRNVFEDNTAKLAAWLSASRVERAPRRAKPAPPPEPAPAA